MASHYKQKYAEIIHLLLEKTKNETLTWQIDFADDLVCTLGDMSIYLSHTRGTGGEPFEIVEIRRDDQSIDRFDDTDLRHFTAPDGYDNYYLLMADLRSMANRQATGADRALDEILNRLKH